MLLCLGALQDTRVLPLALRSLDSDYPLISLAAARAIMEIDPHNGAPLLLQRLNRPGWPLGRLRQLLQLAPLTVRNRSLSQALADAPEPLLIRLLALSHELAESDTEPAMQLALRRFPEDPLVLAQVLRLTAAPGNLPLARAALAHPHDEVRHAALGALGRLGSLKDTDLLAGHLNQDNWYNQQAAAAALMALPGMQPQLALDILPGLNRQSGRLHWLQALSERGWLPANQPMELPDHAHTA